MIKKSNNDSLLVWFELSSLWILNLLLLLSLKYKNQNLSITEFKFTIGNSLNVLFVVINIGLLSICLKIKDVSKIYKTVFNITIAIFITLFVVFVLIDFDIKLPNIYLGYYHIRKVLILLFFFTSLILQFYITTKLLGLFPKRKFKFYEHLMLILIFLSMLYTLSFFHLFKKIEKNNQNYDFGIVLGAAVCSNNKPSPALIERIAKAVELYKDGKIKKIYLTGGNAPGELSEAEVAFRYIQKKYIDKDLLSNIVLENQTKSTSEQVGYIKPLSLHSNKILIISDYLHIQRTREICNFYNVNADVEPTTELYNSQFTIFKLFREATALIIFWLFAY